MPAPLGPFVGFSLGVILAWLSRGDSEITTASRWPRPETLIALFSLLVFAPICGYFIVFAGDWSLAYLIDSRTVPSAIGLLVFLADTVSVLAGFAIARRFAKRHALRAAALAALPLMPVLLFVLIFQARLRVEGTFHQVRSDFGTQSIAGGPLGYALLWMDAILAVGFAFTARLLRVHRRPSRAPDDPSVGSAESARRSEASLHPW